MFNEMSIFGDLPVHALCVVSFWVVEFSFEL